MKAFVRRARWLGDEAFSLSLRKRSCDLLAIRPAFIPVEQQSASCVRVHRTGLVEEHDAVPRAVSEDQSNVAGSLGETPQASPGRDDVRISQDCVVVRVPTDQLREGVRGSGLRIDDEDYGLG